MAAPHLSQKGVPLVVEPLLIASSTVIRINPQFGRDHLSARGDT